MKFLLLLLVAFVNTAPAPTYVTPQAATNIALSLLPSVGGTVNITTSYTTNINALHFDANQFGVSGINIQIKSGVTITNPTISNILYSGYLASDDDAFSWASPILTISDPSSSNSLRLSATNISFVGNGGMFATYHLPAVNEYVWNKWVTDRFATQTNSSLMISGFGGLWILNDPNYGQQLYYQFGDFNMVNTNNGLKVSINPTNGVYSDHGLISGRTNGWTDLVVASPKFGFWRSNNSIYCTMTLPGSPYYTNKLVVP
jgi:hypothetical protein